MALIKNPVGASETIRMLVDAWVAPVQLLIIINDRDADGTDVSWLWDADFERLCGTTQQIIVSGTRAADMQVRMQYAGVDRQQITRIDRIADALDGLLAAAVTGQVVYVLPTYTAMLELRAVLTQRGWVAPFWQD
jgi:hypothetical protein